MGSIDFYKDSLARDKRKWVSKNERTAAFSSSRFTSTAQMVVETLNKVFQLDGVGLLTEESFF